MAYSLGTHTTVIGTGVDSSAIDTSAMNLLIMAVSSIQNVMISVSDNKSNSWNGLTFYEDVFTNFCRVQFFWSTPTTVGTGHTFKATGTDSYLSACIASFSGAKATSPFDQQNGRGDTGDHTTSGSITPTEDNELVLAAISDIETTHSITGTGWSVIDGVAYGAGVNFGGALAYRTQTTAGPENPPWGGSGGNCAIASFKAAAAAAGQPTAKRMGGVKFASHGGYPDGGGSMRWRHEQSGLWLPNNRAIIQPENRLAI